MQVFGDSHLVINSVNGLYMNHNLLLSQLLSEVIRFTRMLDSMVFKHIYRERNSVADGFAKAGSLVQEGAWHVMKHWNSEFSETLTTFWSFCWCMVMTFEEFYFCLKLNFETLDVWLWCLVYRAWWYGYGPVFLQTWCKSLWLFLWIIWTKTLCLLTE